MSVKALEARLNRRLSEIRKGYAVRHLKRLASGEYWFDLALAFNARDMTKVNRVFAEVLGTVAQRRKRCKVPCPASWKGQTPKPALRSSG